MNRIGKYIIEHDADQDKHRKGGMGQIHKGYDPFLKCYVAIKTLHLDKGDAIPLEKKLERFRLEGIALRRLTHKNIVRFYEFDQFEDQFYLVMDYIEGTTIRKIIDEKGKLSWREVIDYAIQALEGLVHAHQNNIFHRDLTPSNMMVKEDGTLILVDFGISRNSEQKGVTGEGSTIGTPEYMSPEQHLAEEVDASTDIYTLGTTLYEELTGKLPFYGEGFKKAIIITRPMPLREYEPSIPKPLEQIILKALEKKPENRFTNAQAFIDALVECRTKIEAEERDGKAKKSFWQKLYLHFKPKPDPLKAPQDSSDDTVQVNLDLNNAEVPNVGNEQPQPAQSVNVAKTRIQTSTELPREPKETYFQPQTEAPGKTVSQRNPINIGLTKNRKAIIVVLLSVLAATPLTKHLTGGQNQNPDADQNKSSEVAKIENKTNPTPPPTKKTWQTLIAAQPIHKLEAKLSSDDLATLTNAADQGNVEVQFYLAQMYGLGKGVSRDEAKADNWYEQAANNNHAEAQLHLGQQWVADKGNTKHIEQGIKWLTQAARQNKTQAKEYLGTLFLEGKNQPLDKKEAQEWMELVAKQGDPKLQNKLGNRFYEGKIIDRDLSQALHWFKQAGDKGLAKAQHNVGFMYEAQKEINTARIWYEKAAKQGYTNAQVSLARLICTPQCSTLKAHKQSFDLLKQAAGKKNPQALHNLAKYYQVGIPGLVHKDIKYAQMLEQQAKDAEAALTKTPTTNSE
ncbi:MAG: serine/threonine-protein kinase [Methyloglobulus sp.]|nr:protein kinase [Methyloglobulus sp.]